jgi:hypothetical protein
MHNEVMDDESLSTLAQEQQSDLVAQIWLYTLALEKHVVKLRKEVNHLSGKASDVPYPDIESDFRVRFFSDHPAYEHFEAELSTEDTDWILPG